MITNNMEKVERQNVSEQNADEMDYGDLIELYYFEVLRHKRPVVERKFEEVVKKVTEKLFAVLGRHPYVLDDAYSEKELSFGNAQARLLGYFKNFHHDLKMRLSEKDFNADMAMQNINAFIMSIHEVLKIHLGQDLLGLSEEDLYALNFINVDKPLEEQEKIIIKKLEELSK